MKFDSRFDQSPDIHEEAYSVSKIVNGVRLSHKLFSRYPIFFESHDDYLLITEDPKELQNPYRLRPGNELIWKPGKVGSRNIEKLPLIDQDLTLTLDQGVELADTLMKQAWQNFKKSHDPYVKVYQGFSGGLDSFLCVYYGKLVGLDLTPVLVANAVDDKPDPDTEAALKHAEIMGWDDLIILNPDTFIADEHPDGVNKYWDSMSFAGNKTSAYGALMDYLVAQVAIDNGGTMTTGSDALAHGDLRLHRIRERWKKTPFASYHQLWNAGERGENPGQQANLWYLGFMNLVENWPYTYLSPEMHQTTQMARWLGIDNWSPFYDPEFMLGICAAPTEMRCDLVEPKPLLRALCREHCPGGNWHIWKYWTGYDTAIHLGKTNLPNTHPLHPDQFLKGHERNHKANPKYTGKLI